MEEKTKKTTATAGVGNAVKIYFKENLGMTIIAYISQTRAKEVRQALLDSDLPLIDIAIMCGFPNVKSMNKVFKDLYHCTPNQFRHDCK